VRTASRLARGQKIRVVGMEALVPLVAPASDL